jgi:predicted enzyme related to lactoylglutathione lyase
MIGFSNQTSWETPMSERDDYEPGVPCWIDTLQPDPDAAMAFYAALFGWEFAGPGQMPGDPPGRYFVARLRGRDVAGIGSQPAGEWSPPSAWSTYVSVASADEAALAAVDAGGEVLVEPFDVLPAGRMAVVADPTGAPFCVWQPGERRGAQLLNEPGAWAMSHLSSPDPERAVAFYGALFGWTTETFGEGDSAITMFRLPGYVGGEPEQPVSREVVATMSAAHGDGAPAWGVNLWDRDVDATAAKAAELGGRVLAAPFDTPMSRMAVLADPHGAPFSISTVPG